MYDTMLAIVFDDEAAAYKGSEALSQLHAAGDITLYSQAVVSKDADGKVEVKKVQDSGPVGMAVGTLVGGLIGMIGGPAGMAIGMLGGMTAGSIRDVYAAGTDATFLGDASMVLAPGKTAVLAEILEGWQVPVDERMGAAGGVVYRKPRVDVIDDQIARDAEAAQKEWDELQADIATANDNAKAALAAKQAAVKASIERTADAAKKRIEALDAEAKAKVAALNAQIEKASGETRSKFEKRRDEIETDLAERKSKLSNALELTKEALS